MHWIEPSKPGSSWPHEGIISTGRYGQRLAHPAVAIERDSRLAAARLFKMLALPDALGESVSPLALKPRRVG